METTNEQIERAQWWISVWTSHQSVLKHPIALKFAAATMDMTTDELEAAWTKWMRKERKAPYPCDLNGDQEKAENAARNVWACLSWKKWPTRKDNGNFDIPDEDYVYLKAGKVSQKPFPRHFISKP